MDKIETPEERIATVEQFTHAVISIVRTITIRNGEEWTPFDQIKQMLTARDALLRADGRQKAAERLMAEFLPNEPFSLERIREYMPSTIAAIMAEPEEGKK